MVAFSSIPLDAETTAFLEKGLNFSIQHHRSLLGDILVEVINIADKFLEETKEKIDGTNSKDLETSGAYTQELICCDTQNPANE
ncbi:unnamed protein product [Protopolystoma xenopodis]|uniref:Uncharacterized protein n=1 Tax=Protopolystoma xenopodis TaxID=117903 RepID=A0A448WHS4_9PLAT|nr:unnamed protein product [Protopolystoma xenopodis]